MKFVTFIFSVLLVSGCSSTNSELIHHAENLNSHNNFGVCYGYGCKYYQKTGITDQEWQMVRNIFSPAAETAAQERDMIAKSIALIEQIIGPKTGTDQDNPGAVIINFNTKNQMDCIDEAFNSTSYLYLMRHDGLIRFHTLGAHLRRGISDFSYPHSTATIHEIGLPIVIEGEGHYVVDSWFHKNGALPEIIPAHTWKSRWHPKEKRERYNFSAS